MKNMLVALAISIFAITSFTGCATMMDGKHQYVPVKSTPPGATIKVDGKDLGQKTPNIIRLERSQRHHIEIVLANHKTAEIDTVRKFNYDTLPGWIFYIFPGVIVDLATGAIYCVDPGEIDVSLEPLVTVQSKKPIAPTKPATISSQPAKPSVVPPPPKPTIKCPVKAQVTPPQTAAIK
jgi:hypothetical protein